MKNYLRTLVLMSGRYNTLFMAPTFADGIIAAATVIDAQVNYELPKLKSTLKLGVKYWW
jgi:hypothetical protein